MNRKKKHHLFPRRRFGGVLMVADGTRYCPFTHIMFDFFVDVLFFDVVTVDDRLAELSHLLFGKEFLFFFGTLFAEFVHQREYVFDGCLDVSDARG